ncbi:MAG: hypothetical protein KJI69_01875 [Patescibacteria group bacterium]|nr:hypothetical protein [Patescibacteria group bacterium]
MRPEILVKHINNRTKSSFGYSLDYKPQSILGQVKCLQQLFPGLGSADEQIANQPLPSNAEGWFAISRWELIASTYIEAVRKVLGLIKQIRGEKFHSYSMDGLDINHLRQHRRTVAMFKELGNQQMGHDILVVPAQFGLYHKGRSIDEARDAFNPSEFGLGIFAGIIMLLMHSKRLQHQDDLWIDFPGDEYSPDGDGEFSAAPELDFSIDKVGFGSRSIELPDDCNGSASAFLPGVEH